MTQDNKVALIGSSGKVGTVILSTLLSHGFAVKALVRDPTRLTVPTQKRLTIHVGDATSLNVLHNLLAECRVVINASSNTGNSSPISRVVTSNIVQLLRDTPSVRYFVITGKTVKTKPDAFSLETIAQRAFLRMRYSAIMKSKQEEYTVLTGAGMNWTMIRCPRIVDGKNDQYCVSLSHCKGKIVTKISIARFILQEMDGREFARSAPFLYNQSLE